MNGGASDTSRQGRADLSTDALFDVLSDATRRTVLFHLRQHGAATLDELVDVLWEVGEYDASDVDRDHVSILLTHVHLPKLEDAGLVTHDRARGVVEVAGLSAEVGEWLDLAVRREIQLEGALERPGSDDPESVRVLLVDDEPGLAETVATHIERENDDMAVTTATSALEAVTALQEDSFDCIVSDYKMPAISGLDFLRAVRDEDPSIPFIVYTAKGSEAAASQAIATGVTDYVQKRPGPDQYEELVERIRGAIEGE